eukprot:scaffold21056_cov78-Cylindrotheca_fusiformis.AAC.1
MTSCVPCSWEFPRIFAHITFAHFADVRSLVTRLFFSFLVGAKIVNSGWDLPTRSFPPTVDIEDEEIEPLDANWMAEEADAYTPDAYDKYTYIDEDGVEKLASNCIRSTSITMVKWSTPLNCTNPILERHPEVTTHLAELAAILSRIRLQSAEEARQLHNDLKQLSMTEILSNGVRVPPAE